VADSVLVRKGKKGNPSRDAREEKVKDAIVNKDYMRSERWNLGKHTVNESSRGTSGKKKKGSNRRILSD